MVVRKVFEVPASAAVDPQVLDKAWEKMSGGSSASTIEASPEIFVEWYTQNMFTPMVTNTMNAGDPSANESYGPSSSNYAQSDTVPCSHSHCTVTLLTERQKC